MAIKFNRSQTFATNGTVTAPALHNLVDGLDIYQALITDQTNLTSVGTADELLIADADLTPNDAPRAVTVQELFSDALTIGTYTDANFTGNLTYGTATGNRTVSTNASITTGTINNATLGTTTGTAATFTNATATGANITNGTIQTLTSSTATITNGTVATLNSTTGTIGNLSTTLAGDLTISQGTSTLGTSGVTAGTYGTGTTIPVISVNAKGLITTVSTSAVTPANASVTPAMLSQPLTLASAVASTSGTAIDFTGIPSWAKRVTVMFNGVSTNGTSPIQLQIGSGSIDAASYECVSSVIGASSAAGGSAHTTGWLLVTGSAYMSSAYVLNGAVTLVLIGSNTWIVSGRTSSVSIPYQFFLSGKKVLSGALDQLRISTIGGTDTFDAGSINIMYEG